MTFAWMCFQGLNLNWNTHSKQYPLEFNSAPTSLCFDGQPSCEKECVGAFLETEKLISKPRIYEAILISVNDIVVSLSPFFLSFLCCLELEKKSSRLRIVLVNR